MSILGSFAWSRVLVVDDTEASATLAEKVLLHGGLRRVDRLLDPRLVLDWIEEHDPDLVLLDLHMPHLDGYELLARIRERASATDLPVIVLTADATTGASHRALELDANDFLTKPLNAIELIHRVRTMVEMRWAHRALHRRQRWLEAAEEFSRGLFAGEVEDPVSVLAQRARELADADLVVVFPTAEPSAKEQCITEVLAWDRTGSLVEAPVLLQPAAHAVAADCSPRLLDRLAGDVLPDVPQDPDAPGTAVLVPICGVETPQGTLCLLRRPGTAPLTAGDLDDANLFVSRAAAAHEIMSRREERQRYLDFFEILVTQMGEYAIVGVDLEGRIASWNAGAERVDRYRAEEVMGRGIAMFFQDEDVVAGLPQRLLDDARKVGESRHQGWAVRAGGERFWAEMSLSALHDARGSLIGFALVTRDLTETRRLELARESFFASVSHDIRAPLTAIQGFAEMIPAVDPDQQDEFLERVRDNVARLGVMVDNMLDHARLRAGELVLDAEPLDLGQAVTACVRDLGPVLATHDVRVKDAGVTVLADQLALGRVLANVLVNAVKYSPVGSSIDVVISTGQLDGQIPGQRTGRESDGTAERTEGLVSGRVSVTDHGRGIDEIDLNTIFNEFERGSLAEPDGGAGLGLSSVHQLVSRQHGSVGIVSQRGEGTTVTIDLPLAID